MGSATQVEPVLSSTETLGGCRYYLFSLRRPGPRAIPGDGSYSVWDHGGGPCTLPQEDCAGQGHFPGHPRVWDPLLDVLHLTQCDGEVRSPPQRSARTVKGKDLSEVRFKRRVGVGSSSSVPQLCFIHVCRNKGFRNKRSDSLRSRADQRTLSCVCVYHLANVKRS